MAPGIGPKISFGSGKAGTRYGGGAKGVGKAAGTRGGQAPNGKVSSGESRAMPAPKP